MAYKGNYAHTRLDFKNAYFLISGSRCNKLLKLACFNLLLAGVYLNLTLFINLRLDFSTLEHFLALLEVVFQLLDLLFGGQPILLTHGRLVIVLSFLIIVLDLGLLSTGVRSLVEVTLVNGELDLAVVSRLDSLACGLWSKLHRVDYIFVVVNHSNDVFGLIT